MKKLYLSLFLVIIAMSSVKADLTVYFDLTGHSWGDLSGGVSIVGTTGNNGSANWSTKKALTYISGNCYSYTITGSTSSIQFNFYVGTTQKAQMPYKNPAGLSSMSEIRYSYGGGTGSTWTQCTTCCQTSSEPVVTWTISSTNSVGGSVDCTSASSSNVSSPVYAYYVKEPNAESYTLISTTTYNFTATGAYIFYATVAETTAPSTILATSATTTVTVSDPITVKVKQSDVWTANPYGIYFWGGASGGPTAMTAENIGGYTWYSYSFAASVSTINMIFVNGTSWNGNDNQTVDIIGVTSSTCYTLNSGSGKKSVTVVNCPSPAVTLTTPASFTCPTITTSDIYSTATDIYNPTYTYYVKTPVSDFVSATLPYTFADGNGNYVFKVEATSDVNTTVWATDTKTVAYAANCTATNVDNVSTLREIKSVELYSISGQRVTESVKGFVIKKTFYKDGSSSTEKTILNK